MDIPFLRPVTVWERYTKNEEDQWVWEHNHIEDGHPSTPTPTPKHPMHDKMWKGVKWRKSFRYLNENNIVV